MLASQQNTLASAQAQYLLGSLQYQQQDRWETVKGNPAEASSAWHQPQAPADLLPREVQQDAAQDYKQQTAKQPKAKVGSSVKNEPVDFRGRANGERADEGMSSGDGKELNTEKKEFVPEVADPAGFVTCSR
jgi:hypothetical protein